REHELNGLVLDDGPAKLDTLLGIAGGEVKGSLGDTKGLSGDAWARAVKRHKADLKAITLLAKKVLGGDDAILEDQFAGLGAADAHLILDLAHMEAGGAALDNKAACALAALG